jgi:hypothetical protein
MSQSTKSDDKRIGNQFWKARAKHGRSKIFSSPKQLWDAACEYFQWVSDNPLGKAIVYQGVVAKESESLMRAMTMKGLCIFLGVNSVYFNHFEDALDLKRKQGKDFSKVIRDIKDIIEVQKFEGASAGLLNANIIARDLGLTDKQSVESKSIIVEIPPDASPEDAAKIYNELMNS